MRIEKDMLGEKQIPLDAYWGIHTARAIDNFNITSSKVNPLLVKVYAQVKKACAQANLELKYLEQNKALAIFTACDEIIANKFNDQFITDALQGGAGTSTNMNVNEVIANRAIELLGGVKGDYSIVHPIEDVNLHQSTNDTYPTALKIASIYGLRNLSKNIEILQGALQKKEKEFGEIITLARTEMQEAVPITMGSMFASFADAIARDRWRTFKCEERLRVVNIGGTAVGTGLCAPRSFIFLVIERLREITGLGISRAENLMDATANIDSLVEVSGILNANASNLIKIADDLRKLNFIDEISLPTLQAGSSIMPGKVNPVVCEAVIQAGIKIMSNDSIIKNAASRGSFQINEFLPLVSFALLESIDILINANIIFSNYIDKIFVNTEICKFNIYKSTTLITAFIPLIGYEKASIFLEEYKKSGRSNFHYFLIEKFGKEMVDKILSTEKLMSLGYKEDDINT